METRAGRENMGRAVETRPAVFPDAQDRGDTLGRVSADRGPCTHGGACAHGRICELMESPPHQRTRYSQSLSHSIENGERRESGERSGQTASR